MQNLVVIAPCCVTCDQTSTGVLYLPKCLGDYL